MNSFADPPVIAQSSPKKVTVQKVMSQVKLSCSASGSPLPSVEWSKDGNPLSVNTSVKQSDTETTGELVIEPFTPEHQGMYKCFFRNYDNGTAEKVMRVCKYNI